MSLVLLSPLQGWCAGLPEVPDPVFAEGMMGDGMAIDPIGTTLHAPCDATVVVAPATRHSITVRADNGVEILMHVGIDTVALAGDGFRLHVKEGDRVRPGDRLLTFDLEVLARRARSLMTPVLVTNGGEFRIARRCAEGPIRPGDFFLELEPVVAGREGSPGSRADAGAGVGSGGVAGVVAGVGAGPPMLERPVAVVLGHGIHARPAAAIAAALRGFESNVFVVFNDRRANAKSPVALMSLGVRHQDRVVITAQGPDADLALNTVERALTTPEPRAAATAVGTRTNLGPTGASASPAGEIVTTAPPASGSEVKAVIAARGLAMGNAYPLARAEVAVEESGRGVVHEQAELQRARDSVRSELLHTAAGSNLAASEVAQAHLQLLDDPEVAGQTESLLAAGRSAGYAWRTVLRQAASQLRALNDSRMAERADDLLDLESRVLAALSGGEAPAAVIPPESILIARELLPSQLVALDRSRLAGICLAGGGATSHVAIIAASMDIPMLVAAGEGVLGIAVGVPLVLDADNGSLSVDPSHERLEAARDRVALLRARRTAEWQAAQEDGRTADGIRIEMFANLGSEADARTAIRNGAEGCGLLRTEFLFLERTSPPDESEQLQQYQAIATALEGRPLVIRTMDIGGDKPIPYLPLPPEENPALGLRGVRTSLWRPDLLREQLRAILRVQPAGQCRILLPMITEVGEIRTVRRILAELQDAGAAGQSILVGAMVETPACALLADSIAREVDFLSIGTNDLTQYTLAMDRGHPELAARLDGLHPAVLRAIERVTAAARNQQKLVAVCGGLASDPVAVPILIGLGVQELSMVPAAIAPMKALIRTLDMNACVQLAARALQQDGAAAVRALTR